MYASTRTVGENPPDRLKTVEIRIRGMVQGAGFKPAVWRLAKEHGLVGLVRNDGQGVFIMATGEQTRIARFLSGLAADPPPRARIEAVAIHRLDQALIFGSFEIADNAGGETPACLAGRAEIHEVQPGCIAAAR